MRNFALYHHVNGNEKSIRTFVGLTIFVLFVLKTQLLSWCSSPPTCCWWARRNVHQWNCNVLADTAESSFTLREKHYNSSSKLLCVSLLKHKDGTRTIEMILVSTVLKLAKDISRVVAAGSTFTCGCLHDKITHKLNRTTKSSTSKERNMTTHKKQRHHCGSNLRLYLIEMDPEESSKHCIAAGISRRLAGYWEKFSISNHHVSVELHRLW